MSKLDAFGLYCFCKCGCFLPSLHPHIHIASWKSCRASNVEGVCNNSIVYFCWRLLKCGQTIWHFLLRVWKKIDSLRKPAGQQNTGHIQRHNTSSKSMVLTTLMLGIYWWVVVRVSFTFIRHTEISYSFGGFFSPEVYIWCFSFIFKMSFALWKICEWWITMF